MKKKLAIFLLSLIAWMHIPAFATVIVDDADPNICDFRCTLVSGSSIADGSTSGNATVYGDADGGNQISVYDGVAHWNKYTLASEIGYALSGIVAGNMYDLYIYWNGTAFQFDTPVVWPNISTPPARTKVNGVWLKTGALTRRLVASFYATGTNLTMDTAGGRCLCNQQHRVPRAISANIPGGYTYGGGWRNAAGALNIVASVGQTFVWIVSSDGTTPVKANSDVTVGTASSGQTTCILALNGVGQATSSENNNIYGIIATGTSSISATLPAGFSYLNNQEYSSNSANQFYTQNITGTIQN
ncbi:MAG TPA: hypothetical protein VHV83_07115 [Armatimonadota bacterium]|nr:hypothetical protein [Armatimonadota bacterium]